MRTLLSLPFFILFTLPFCSDAQWKVEKGPGKVRLGSPYEAIETPSKSFYTVDDEILALKKEDQELYFQCYDPEELEEEARSMTELEDKKMVHEGTFPFAGDLYFFYAWWEDDREEERLFYRKLDRRSCELESAQKLFGYEEHRMKGQRAKAGFLSWKTVDKFDFFTSMSTDEKDAERLLIRFRVEPDEHEQAEEKYLIGYTVFNKKMEQQWHETYLMPYKQERMDRVGTSVNEDSEVYMLARVREGDDPDDDDAPCHYEIFKFDGEEADFDHAKLEFEDDLEAEGDRFYLNNSSDGGVSFDGFYSHKEEDVAKGIFTAKIDPSGGATKIHTIPFSAELIAKYEGEDRLSDVKEEGLDDPEVGLSDLEIETSRIYENGDVLLVAEQYYMITKMINDIEHTDHHYKDIVVARVSPSDGNLKWAKKLPKEQEGNVGGRDLSFRLFTNDEELQFVFFDNDENLEMKTHKEPEKHQGQVAGYLTAYRLDHENGDITKQELLDITDVKGKGIHQYWLSRFVSVGPDSFIFEGMNEEDRDFLIEVNY